MARNGRMLYSETSQMIALCVCVYDSSWNRLAANGVWTVLLPRDRVGKKEIRPAWLEHTGMPR